MLGTERLAAISAGARLHLLDGLVSGMGEIVLGAVSVDGMNDRRVIAIEEASDLGVGRLRVSKGAVAELDPGLDKRTHSRRG